MDLGAPPELLFLAGLGFLDPHSVIGRMLVIGQTLDDTSETIECFIVLARMLNQPIDVLGMLARNLEEVFEGSVVPLRVRGQSIEGRFNPFQPGIAVGSHISVLTEMRTTLAPAYDCY